MAMMRCPQSVRRDRWIFNLATSLAGPNGRVRPKVDLLYDSITALEGRLMHVRQFGTFGKQFGLIKGGCEMVSQGFLDWQMTFLPEYGMRLTAEPIAATISDALRKLLPRTVPIVTRYLFWPLNKEWTLYFDNGRLGTDASPPSVLASLLHTDGIRISLADHAVDLNSKHVLLYGATIFEYFENVTARRSVFVANDGGKWVFRQEGIAFPFEDESSYRVRQVRDRFPKTLLLQYLQKLGASLDGTETSTLEPGPGRLIVKAGRMPRDLKEFYE